MIGEGYGGHARFLRPVNQVADPAGAIQQAVFTMDVQMDKINHPNVSFLYSDFRNKIPSHPRSPW